MNKDNRLLQIAERQQGYFTSRQAVECDFSQSLKEGFEKVSDFYNDLHEMSKSKV